MESNNKEIKSIENKQVPKSLTLDLTTKEGRENASRLLEIGLMFNPILYLAFKLIDKHQEGQRQQEKIVENIIVKGKEQGVDSMTIKMNNVKGFKLNIPVEDVKIDTTIGANDTITLNVKYK